MAGTQPVNGVNGLPDGPVADSQTSGGESAAIEQAIEAGLSAIVESNGKQS